MHEDVKWLFGLLIVFGIVWFASGGLNAPTSKRPFIKPLVGQDAGQTYGMDTGGNNSSGNGGVQGISQDIKDAKAQADKIQKELAALEAAKDASPLAGKLTLASIARSASVATEYAVINSSRENAVPYLITGLQLKSAATGNGAAIGQAVSLPFQNQINVLNSVYLSPGQTAYIITGRSPIGYSFRLNKCTGYFNQNQNFTPRLPSRCPAPRTEPLPVLGAKYSDACLNYIDTLPACKAVVSPPLNLSPECQQFVSTEYNYTKCVERHKNDPDFYDSAWMIYLGRTDTLWKNQRELVKFTDQNGKIIGTVAY